MNQRLSKADVHIRTIASDGWIAQADRPSSQAVISIITLPTSPTLPAIFSAVSISSRR
jgi:hypothetical protein